MYLPNIFHHEYTALSSLYKVNKKPSCEKSKHIIPGMTFTFWVDKFHPWGKRVRKKERDREQKPKHTEVRLIVLKAKSCCCRLLTVSAGEGCRDRFWERSQREHHYLSPHFREHLQILPWGRHHKTHCDTMPLFFAQPKFKMRPHSLWKTQEGENSPEALSLFCKRLVQCTSRIVWPQTGL